MIILTKIKEIDNIIYSYVKDLELWDTYEYVINILKRHIKEKSYNYMDDNGNIFLEKWLDYKMTLLDDLQIDPSKFEIDVEFRYKIDFEMMLYDQVGENYNPFAYLGYFG